MSGFRRGVRLGIDVGSVRVGVARTDPDGVLAVPVATVRRTKASTGLAELVGLIAEYQPFELVVGLPLTLSGDEGAAVLAVRTYLAQLVERLSEAGLDVPVRLVDERLSTAAAAKGLRSAGRDTRRSREVIDQAAAVIIVQDAITAERSTGIAPGQLFEPGPAGGGPARGTDDRR